MFKMDDLEATFAIDNSQSTSSQLVASPTRKQAVTTLLDITRANNIAIMLSRIKLGYPDIRKALLDVDDFKLSVDDLKAISKQLPTAEEMSRIKDFGDVSKLAKADQYFNEIMTIPRLSERIECMLYRRKLELDIEEVRPELDVLRNASQQLRSSKRFKQVLQAILTVGNALNGSTFRGGARGFQLEALLKLKETRTVKGGPECPTLLHYVAKVLLRTDPSLVTFADELPHLEAAARVSVQTVVTSVNSLTSGLGRVQQEVRNLQQATTPPGDRFIVVMQPFISQVTPSVNALKSMVNVVERELRSLLLYYGENPDSSDAPKYEDFFALVVTFSSNLQKAALEVHDAAPKLAPTASSVSVFEEESDKTPESTIKGSQDGQTLRPPPDSQGRVGGLSVGRGDLDQAIRSMRTGKRRARPNRERPLSKIFLDGSRQSRIFE